MWPGGKGSFFQRKEKGDRWERISERVLLRSENYARMTCLRVLVPQVGSSAGYPGLKWVPSGDPSSASAFSSQKPMSISRYLVVAIVNCSAAFALLPVWR